MHYGIDVGGTKIELAIFDKKFNQIDSWRIATPQDSSDKFISDITKLVDKADVKTGTKGSVGIGIPGIIDSKGRILSANIACINGKNITSELSCALSRTVTFQNDMNMFALSEACRGAGENHKHVLGLILGTGLGGGLCIDQELYLGKHGFAREIGHIPMTVNLQKRYGFPVRDCGCGLSGCMEQYLSGPGLLWMVSFFGGNYDSTPNLILGLKNNEESAKRIFAAYIDCLGSYFAQLTLMFDPDIIVLGGGLSNVKQIYQQLPDATKQYLFECATPPKIVSPKFGDSSGVRGAALLGSRINLVNAKGN